MTNLAKSFFISLYITCLLVASVHSVYGLIDEGLATVWLGISVSVLPSLLFFVRLFLAPVARTSANLNGVLVMAVLGASLSWFMASDAAQVFYSYLYAFALGVGGALLYIYWYSRLGRVDSAALKEGENIPEFELTKVDGTTWNSSERTNHPALILFYRGNWCPLCMAQIKEVAAHYKTLESMGVKVCLVSPQPEQNTQTLAEKFEVNYEFLSDQNNEAAIKLGINAPNGTPKGMEVLGYDSDTVLPTAILTNASGAIIFTDQTDNYRVRPEPETFLRVFQEHGLRPAQ